MLSASTGNGGPDVTILNNNTPNGNSGSNLDDIPTVIDFPSQPQKGSAKNANNTVGKKVELDNAGRVKSGKVRKQCELCGEWSNIKWFFKHMSEVHQVNFNSVFNVILWKNTCLIARRAPELIFVQHMSNRNEYYSNLCMHSVIVVNVASNEKLNFKFPFHFLCKFIILKHLVESQICSCLGPLGIPVTQ